MPLPGLCLPMISWSLISTVVMVCMPVYPGSRTSGGGICLFLCRVQCFVQGSLIRHVIFLRHLHVIRIPFPHLLLTDAYLIVWIWKVFFIIPLTEPLVSLCRCTIIWNIRVTPPSWKKFILQWRLPRMLLSACIRTKKGILPMRMRTLGWMPNVKASIPVHHVAIVLWMCRHCGIPNWRMPRILPATWTVKKMLSVGILPRSVSAQILNRIL